MTGYLATQPLATIQPGRNTGPPTCLFHSASLTHALTYLEPREVLATAKVLHDAAQAIVAAMAALHA